MRLILCLVALVLVLGACSTKPRKFADEAAVRAVSYREPGPATITLYTVVRNQTGGGAHTALLINASERVIFDPAGSFYSDLVPEQHDVLFGITRNVEFFYRSGHARSTHHVLSQTVRVTREQAEIAYELAKKAGPVTDGFCASATAKLLQQVPGFEGIKSSMWPSNLSDQFAQLPGVVEDRYYEDDDPDLAKALAENNAKIAAGKLN